MSSGLVGPVRELVFLDHRSASMSARSPIERAVRSPLPRITPTTPVLPIPVCTSTP